MPDREPTVGQDPHDNLVDFTQEAQDRRRLRNPALSAAMDEVDELFMDPLHTGELKKFAGFVLGKLQQQEGGRRPIRLNHLFGVSDRRLIYADKLESPGAEVPIFFAFGSMDQTEPSESMVVTFPPEFFPLQGKGRANQWISFEQMQTIEHNLAQALKAGLNVADYSRVVERLGGAFGYDRDGYYILTPDREVRRLVVANDSIERNRRRRDETLAARASHENNATREIGGASVTRLFGRSKKQ